MKQILIPKREGPTVAERKVPAYVMLATRFGVAVDQGLEEAAAEYAEQVLEVVNIQTHEELEAFVAAWNERYSD